MVVDVDTTLYSRQVFAIGMDAQRKLLATDFLLVGLGPLGAEVAKNLILTGAKSISILDDAQVGWLDLAAHPFASPTDAAEQRNRVEASLPSLRALNVAVTVSRVTGDVSDAAFLSQYRCVIFCDVAFTAGTIAKACEVAHSVGVKVVAAECRGVAGCIFVDAGDSHTAVDRDGRDPPISLITGITADSRAVVTVHDEDPHDLSTGDTVILSDVAGDLGTHLNGRSFEVVVTSATSFSIPFDSSALPLYTRGGYCRSVKQPFDMSFKPLSGALAAPEFAITSTAKIGEQGTVLAFFRGLHEQIVDTIGTQITAANVRPHCAADKDAVERRAAELLGAPLSAEDRALVRALTGVAPAALSSMASIVGGQAAQEAVKVVSNKFVPVHQFWVYTDVPALPMEVQLALGIVAPVEGVAAPAVDFTPRGDRYDSQVIAFGRAFDEQLRLRRAFIVGAGALGCEYVKMFSLMGIGTIIITDMDHIEKSNLSRQFLFRSEHIGRPKSVVAGEAARKFNSDVRVVVYEDRVGPATENVFTRSFWASLDIVCNALDNVEARRYVDAQCVVHARPLLECGTQGVMANTQVILPHLTLSYSSTIDVPARSIAVCTLKLYPNLIEHTIQWARDRFEELFANVPSALRDLITSRSAFVERASNDPSAVQELLGGMEKILSPPALPDFDACVALARDLFDNYFRNQILQLTHSFPADARSSSGAPFWGGPRRFPTAITFSADDPSHVDVIEATACLLASVYNIIIPDVGGAGAAAAAQSAAAGGRRVNTPARDALRAHIADVARRCASQPWVPTTAERLPEDDKAAEAMAKEAAMRASRGITEMIDALPAPSAALTATPPTPASFEKDDDTNWHVAFIAAVSNLRARNYAIEEADFERTKRVAGSIVPAMITTTVLAVGLMGNEFIKTMDLFGRLALLASGDVGAPTLRRKMRKDPLDDFLDSWVNVAIPFIDGSSPRACPTERWLPENYTPPAGKRVNPDMTLWSSIVADLGKDATVKVRPDNRHDVHVRA